jgi:hypothetical protein
MSRIRSGGRTPQFGPLFWLGITRYDWRLKDMIKRVITLAGLCGLVGLIATPTLAQDKMGKTDKMGGKMAGDKMGGKMAGDKMGGKMAGSKMGHKKVMKKKKVVHHKMTGKMTHTKMGGKMAGDKMGGKMDKMGGDKMAPKKGGKM